MSKYGFSVFGFLLLIYTPVYADPVVTSEDINNFADMVHQATDAFMQESFHFRLKFEYDNNLPNQREKQTFQKLAQKVASQLLQLAEEQKSLKSKIENYTGDDWDQRYGSTGLWRKLSEQLCRTNLIKCEIEYRLAISSDQRRKNEILDQILQQIDLLQQSCGSVYLQFSRARVLAAAGQTKPQYRQSAIELLNSLMIRPDIPQSTAFRITFEQIKLTRPEKGQLEKLTKELTQSSCRDDLELVLSLAFLQLKYARQSVEKTFEAWPQIEGILSEFVLADLNKKLAEQKDLSQISVIEAELATLAVWKNDTGEYEELLDYFLSKDTFQTPLIFYIAAVKSAQSKPAKTVKLLIKAGKAQKKQKSTKLDVAAEEIAGQAGRLAYSLFREDSSHCGLAIEIFENYGTIAGEKIDHELEYLHSVVLYDCGRTEDSQVLLEKIAGRSVGKWPNRAKLDLIIRAINQSKSQDPANEEQLLEQLRQLIAEAETQNHPQIKIEALKTYSQLRLEGQSNVGAEEIAAILGEDEIAQDANLAFLKSKALRQLGKKKQAVEYMLPATGSNRCMYTAEAITLLAEIVDKIEMLQAADKNCVEALQKYKQLAEVCYGCIGDRISGLILAEISILTADKNTTRPAKIKNLLNDLQDKSISEDVDFIRCKARLLGSEDKFSQAAELWAKICRIRKTDLPQPNKRSWKWWRAKFYELDCASKIPSAKKNDIIHTIDVLESSYSNIPSLWAERLKLLKHNMETGSN